MSEILSRKYSVEMGSARALACCGRRPRRPHSCTRRSHWLASEFQNRSDRRGAIRNTRGRVCSPSPPAYSRLIEQIQSVQSAAKQEFFAKNKPALADYYYGQNVQGMSRSNLETCATNILDKAKVADLPGIEAAELQALDDALEAYRGVETEQSGEQSAATTARKALEKLVKDIGDQRRELQFAADALWPAGTKENAGIRREFDLPGNKAFKG